MDLNSIEFYICHGASQFLHDTQEYCNALVLYISLALRFIGVSCMQFLVGCAHLRKQPLFQGACETAFEKCRDPETSEISRAQLADVLQLSTLLPSDKVKSPLPLCYNT